MALVLHQQVETKIPIEVEGVAPDRISVLSESEIGKFSIWHGNEQVELGSIFKISGSCKDDQTIVFNGHLDPVHGIGASMSSGTIKIKSNTGRHVGRQMIGGIIVAEADVSDFAGVEMKGGTIRIGGNAGNSLGGRLPGSKLGMNRGTIQVAGSVGKGAGQGMRRGTIVIAGDAGELLGWNMLAGSILVFGSCGSHAGAGMKRGTIFLNQYHETDLLPTFSNGGKYQMPMMAMMANWLETQELDIECKKLLDPIQVFHGDMLSGSRGEILISSVA